jgi:hypothetical protein
MNTSPTGRPSPSRGPELSAALGWRFFAGIVMLLLGILNLIDGLIGIMDPDLFRDNLSGNPTLPVTDRLEVWGWVVLVLGLVMVVLAFPVMGGLRWARLTGIVAAGIDLLLQFAYLAHFPVWSLIMIFLNVLVIYGLAVRGGEPTELDTR